ncbi:MAG: SMP-30/gluconolactonase/LRE family protein [SAR202 cluster bacterium]|nr:SMP-30/gluconolactonase/LRE family protein [SAR202 cluster bacterium]
MAVTLKDLVAGEPKQIATGFGFTEGPVWHPDGYVLFTQIDKEPHFIWKVAPGKEKELWRSGTGRATGLTLDLQGRVIACEQLNRRVSRQEKDGTVVGIATHCEGKRLNRPNDVVGISDGSLYFTNRGAGSYPPEQTDIPQNGVYRIAPNGDVQPAVYPFVDPNGLAFSPDEKTFYLINTRPSMHIDAFDVQKDGSLTNQRRFHTFKETGEPGFPDGMKLDQDGRIYCTGPGGIHVIEPNGNVIGVIKLPEQSINMGWGDADNKTLYVAAMTSVYSLRMHVAGLKIPRAKK